MPKTVLIAAYFGRWPAWFPAFLQSCRHNPAVDWLIFTDIPAPPAEIPNLRFVTMTLGELEALAIKKLQTDIKLARPYKVCDLRPAFGVVFEDFLEGYDFWGHCDIDIVWGDIREFVSEEMLGKYDVISARKERVCGHFTLFRNCDPLNRLFERDPAYLAALREDSPFYYDEVGMTALVRAACEEGAVKVYWPRFLLNFPDAETRRDGPSRLGPEVNRWVWRRGKLFERSQGEREVMYLHFVTWKKSLQACYFGYSDDPTEFFVSYSHVGTEEHDTPPGGVLASIRRRWSVFRA